MYIIETVDNARVECRQGEKKPMIPIGSTEVLFIKSLQATEKEFTYIVVNFRGIRKPAFGAECIWRNEEAQFIYDNL